jgi:hypothetical protein
MAVCDMCNGSMPRGTGLLVPGKSTSSSFKKGASNILSMMGLSADETRSAIDETADELAASPSLVCDGCAGTLGLSPSQVSEGRRKAAVWWQSH